MLETEVGLGSTNSDLDEDRFECVSKPRFLMALISESKKLDYTFQSSWLTLVFAQDFLQRIMDSYLTKVGNHLSMSPKLRASRQDFVNPISVINHII